MIVMTSKIRVKAEKEKEFIGLAAVVVNPARADKGCLSYEFFEDPLEPGVFLFIEKWKSWEDLHAHLEKPYTKDFFELLPRYAIQPPEITSYESRGGQPMSLS
jgi:quinol monooxygenase YgiN